MFKKMVMLSIFVIGGIASMDIFAVNGSTDTGLKNVICKNVTSGQSLTIKNLKGATSWDCTAAGLLAKNGDTIKETLTSTVIDNGKSCKEILASNPKSISGTYIIDPDGLDGNTPFQVYCDMTTDGGGWTLLEIGKALGTNLRTADAVGLVTSPNQATSAKLARATAAAIVLAGDKKLRWGLSTTYGYLYTGVLENSWVTDGYGALDYGTTVTPNFLSLDASTTVTYPGSRFAWPIDGPPEGCLNSDGGTGECGGGLHIGTWQCCGWSERGDNAYVNHSVDTYNYDANNGYEVWGR